MLPLPRRRGGFGRGKDRTMKIYVGNLPWTIDDDALAELFEEYGEVSSAKVVANRAPLPRPDSVARVADHPPIAARSPC